MKYINKITGATIEVASICSGENWERVDEKPAKSAPKKKGVKESDKLRDN